MVLPAHWARGNQGSLTLLPSELALEVNRAAVGGAEGLPTQVGGGAEGQHHPITMGGAGDPALPFVVLMEGVGLEGGGARTVTVATWEVVTPPGMGHQQLQEAVVPPVPRGWDSKVVLVEAGSALSADRKVNRHGAPAPQHSCGVLVRVLV